jgi:geranylgeranyl diphosphate synthase, type I
MDVRQELKSFKERLDPKIASYFDTVIAEAGKEDDLVAESISHMRELVLSGGKRLRAALMYYGYLAAGGREEEKIIDTTVAVELIHAFLLVHDDIIDRDAIRHGVPTLHSRYTDYSKRFFPDKDAEHFGESIALIMGDMLFAFGNDIIFRAPFDKELVFKTLSKLQNIVSFTVIGQARDVYMEYKRDATEEEILKMYVNKTAKYTVEGPLHLGAVLAGATPELLEDLSAYAIPLGIAFQIQDDILGVFGSEERIGKPIGSDIAEGKITLLVSLALKEADNSQRDRLKHILGLGDAMTLDDVAAFRSIMEMSGALAGARSLSIRYIAEGKAALERLRGKIDPRAHEFLSGIAEYMLDRDR